MENHFRIKARSLLIVLYPCGLFCFFMHLYLLSGACMFPLYETQGFVDALYFTFISSTTIGYGDVYPKNMGFMIITMLYLSFGFALNILTIEILGDFLHRIHNFGQEHLRNSGKTKVWLGGQQVQLQDTGQLRKTLKPTQTELIIFWRIWMVYCKELLRKNLVLSVERSLRSKLSFM